MAENSEWYVSRGGQQIGPMSRAQLQEFHQSGKLAASDDIWAAELGDWKPAGTIFKFTNVFPPPPPVRGVPQANVRQSAPSPTVTTTVVEGGSFKFGTFVWIVIGLIIPLWPITLPLCLYFAYRSYKKPTTSIVHTMSQ